MLTLEGGFGHDEMGRVIGICRFETAKHKKLGHHRNRNENGSIK